MMSNPQYVINEQGERISVILPVAEYEELIEDLEDLARIAERREEPAVTHEELLARLRADGLTSAEKELRRLSREAIGRLVAIAEGLKENAFPPGVRKLAGTANTYRIRWGD